MEKELFSKEWNTNTLKIVEAIIMLDIIQTINEKAWAIDRREIKAFIDIKDL